MNFNLYNDEIIKDLKSKSQKVRVLTENWVGNNIYCPSCGNKINNYENNKPVADFYCLKNKSYYE